MLGGILIQGLVLIAVLSVLTGEDFNSSDVDTYVKAGLLAGCTIFGTLFLAGTLGTILPDVAATFLGFALAAGGLAFAIAHFYEIALKRAMAAASVYLVVSFALHQFLGM